MKNAEKNQSEKKPMHPKVIAMRKALKAISDGLGSLEMPAPPPAFVAPTREANESDLAFLIRQGTLAAAYAKASGGDGQEKAFNVVLRNAITSGLSEAFKTNGINTQGRPVGTPARPRKTYTQADREKAYVEFSKDKPKPVSELEMALGVQAQTLNLWRKAAGFTNGGKGIGKDAFLALYAGKVETNEDDSDDSEETSE